MSKPLKKHDQKYDVMVKVVVVGDSSVGKTNILLRFSEDQFKVNHIATIGVDFKIKTIQVGDQKVKLQIWDTAGQQKFRNIAQTYYKGAAGLILVNNYNKVYSITDKASFENIRGWMKRISQSTDQNISKVIVGNKCDNNMDRKVTHQQGCRLAQSYECPFYQTSAKQNINIQEAFMALAQQMKTKISQDQSLQLPNKVYLQKKQDGKKFCQC